jgi:metal-dependent amidase/aminoacylase/carboxypeptidase family protein
VVAARLRPVFAALTGEGGLNRDFRLSVSEDVSALMAGIPGVFLFVGAAAPGANPDYGHHHPGFTFDEDALPLGVALMTAAVASYVLPG